MKKLTMIPFLILALTASSGCGLVKSKEQEDEALTSAGIANLIFEAGNEVGVNNPGVGLDLAQSFTPSALIAINFVEVTMIKTGTPNGAGTVTLTIQPDSAGSPNNMDVGGFTAVRTVADINTTHTTIRFNFSGLMSLQQGQKYWLRMRTSLPSDAVHGVKWAATQNNSFPGGEAKYQLATTLVWSNAVIPTAFVGGANQDFTFRFGRQ